MGRALPRVVLAPTPLGPPLSPGLLKATALTVTALSATAHRRLPRRANRDRPGPSPTTCPMGIGTLAAWEDVRLDRAKFASADLTANVFSRAQARDSVWSGAKLVDAPFRKADLTKAQMWGVTATRANAEGAIL
jgi:uncharacterized protein YjbI with pentapeptide repeats